VGADHKHRRGHVMGGEHRRRMQPVVGMAIVEGEQRGAGPRGRARVLGELLEAERLPAGAAQELEMPAEVLRRGRTQAAPRRNVVIAERQLHASILAASSAARGDARHSTNTARAAASTRAQANSARRKPCASATGPALAKSTITPNSHCTANTPTNTSRLKAVKARPVSASGNERQTYD